MELELDRTGLSHGAGSHPLHPPRLQGARGTVHTTEGSRAHHLSHQDPGPAIQQVVTVLTPFGEQQVSTDLKRQFLREMKPKF